ncbi:MAG TPA: ComEC family competence protein, partial [Bacteroidetes bacterium]|nr:ComEC family competence protein [Bacteroidota bacterium]
MFWQGRPFLRILPFFAAGILVAHQGFNRDKLLLPAVVFLWALLMAAYAGTRIRSFKFGWIPGVLLFTSVFFTGFVLTIQQIQKSNRPLPEGKVRFWQGKLLTEPVQRKHAVKFILKVTGTFSPDSTFPAARKVLAYLQADSLPGGLHPGSRMVFSGKMQPVAPPGNPQEFDYRQFLLDRGIKYRTYINRKAWQKLPSVTGFSLPVLFEKWRNRLLHILRSQGLTPNEYSIAAAILLGYDQLIDPGIHQDFTAAGAVHILCVSGMHVGIVYLILSFLFRFLLRFKQGNQIRNLLLLLGIWAYALLTGLSPSVSRAATMLSLFIAAEMLDRTYDRFNILAASAFLLLAVNPLMLFDVGFQLSYAAVSGILLFYFPLYRSVWLGNKILQ